MRRSRIAAAVLISAMLAGAVAPIGPAATGTVSADGGTASGSNASAGGNKDVLDALFGGGGDAGKNSKNDQSGDNGQVKKEDKAVRPAQETDYFDALKQWEQNGIKATQGAALKIVPNAFRAGGTAAALEGDSKGYGKSVFRWESGTPEMTFDVSVPEDGLYTIAMDYYPLSDKLLSIERGIKINGSFPYFQAKQFELYKYWKDKAYPFAKDALGNDVLPEQTLVSGWRTGTVEDPASADDRALLFHLKRGTNTIALTYLSEPILLGDVTVASPQAVNDYEAYRKTTGSHSVSDQMILLEAESAAEKNKPFIRAQSDGSPSSVPFDNGHIQLNAIGGDSWQLSGQSVTWHFSVPEDGDYRLAFKYKQNTNTKDTGTDMPVYRTIHIDGAIPFEELRQVDFPFVNDWTNRILAKDGGNGEPYLISLTKGEHTLTLTADDTPYRDTIRTIRSVMSGINDLAIQVKMATGNTKDNNRDWDLTEQIPDVADRMNGYADELDAKFKALTKRIGRNPDAAKNMIISAGRLRALAKDPNSLPYRYAQLSEGSGSIMQLLGNSLAKLPNQPLTLDRIYVYSGKKLPAPQAGMMQRLKANLLAFFGSFSKDYSKMGGEGEDAIQVWVNRPRQYVMLMQQMANEEFTKKTGIKVSFSLMPDETKLILANAAGNSPDVALSINNVTPFNLAMRGTLADLTQFPDYGKTAKRFSPGAMLPFQFDGGTYALPETQNFWVLYYRKDILDALHIPVPGTMDDVRRILPDLQRYGLNFYDPLSATGGYKPFWLTVPLIYQNGGELFKPDGSGTAIDSENAVKGLKQMTDLFTVYNLPLNVPSFYNHFRDGSMPIGISDFATYIQLTAAAPEINGLWKIAPLPGTASADGTVQRWAPGTGQSTVIFNNSKHKKEAWELLKWWTSADTQKTFGNRMQMIYGPTYKWNTANLEAFGEMPWPAEDIRVIEEQWKWLKDIPHLPGDYMLERQISDAWNKVVFNGLNPRRAIEDATILTNREMEKKQEEFGYRKDGKLLRPLKVPQLPDATAASAAGAQTDSNDEGQVGTNEAGG